MQNRFILPCVVFITGACILIVEVLATRVLAPYFGSTITTVSSVIGVVLGALSVGYYLGGRVADARPSTHIFYGLITASGISVFVLEALLLFALPSVGYALPLVSGPLIASLALFFVPSALLGCLSPFAITLQKKKFPDVGIGTLSGEIFFWSTMGSIAGSLSAGFVLIPQWGTHVILVGMGSVLVVLGGGGVFLSRSRARRIAGVLGALIIVLTIGPGLLASADAYRNSFLHLEDGVYERIALFDGIYKERPTRFLQQDRSSSSAMFLDSDELVFEYTKYYQLATRNVSAVRYALVLGVGAYSVPKALLADYPDAIVDVVDIEPGLEALSKEFFNLYDDPRLHTYTYDARRFLRNPPHQYDVIFSDIYASLYSLPVHAATREFFAELKKALAPDGIVVANVIGSLSRQEPSLTFSLARTMQEEFNTTAFFAVQSPEELMPQNIMFVGINGEKHLDAGEWEQKRIDLRRYDLSRYPIFTDVHAPVERTTLKLFSLIGEGNGFSGDETLALISKQLRFGSRFVGSNGHAALQEFLEQELRAYADITIVQRFEHEEQTLANVIARFNPEQMDRVILGTHYDTNPTPPTPGANNGASGTAVLLELARLLALEKQTRGVDLVFFDAEEGLHGAQAPDWRPLGSEYFAAHLNELYPIKKPQSAVVIDMVCEKGAQFEKEQSSLKGAPDLVNTFLTIARGVSPDAFPDTIGPHIRDDHTALQAAGIPSLLLIDLEYRWIYSLNDMPDKCSADNLQSVGDALLAYLKEGVDGN